MNVIINTDAKAFAMPGGLEVMANCVVTSPPYYKQRRSGDHGEIGWESTPEQYVATLVSVFNGIRENALHETAPVFVNIGDVADGSGWIGIPWLFARAMRDAGWYLISEIIWYKPNAMPSGAAARHAPSPCHETVFMFSATKATNTVYDFIGGSEPGKTTPTRLPRTVWSIALDSYKGTHFAGFPLELARRCIVLGSTERICLRCSAPVLRQWTSERRPTRPGRSSKTTGLKAEKIGRRDTRRHVTDYKTTGWAPSCECDRKEIARLGVDPFAAGVVLDPFAGHGTAAIAALEEAREFVAVELGTENCRSIEERVRKRFPDARIHTRGYRMDEK